MIELLAYILHCPICNNKYNAEQTNIIETQDGEKYDSSSMLVHTECERCKSSVVFSISLQGPEIFSIGMVTDLTSGDAKRFGELGGVSVDEVIDFHDFITQFDGDWQKVLQ